MSLKFTRPTLFVSLFLAAAAFAQQINMVLPSSGRVTSPVRVVADLSSTLPIHAISVFVDRNEVKHLQAVTPVDVYLPVAEGSHVLTVTAVQANGIQLSTSRAIEVAAPTNQRAMNLAIPSSTTSSSPLTYSNIEQMPGWYTYPDQGNPVCSSKPAIKSSPSLDGTSGQFYLGPRGQYNNCLWPILLGSSSTLTHFQLDTHYQLSNPSVAQGIEFSSNKHIGTQWYKFSVQCSYNKGVFSVWNTAGATWSPTGIPCRRPAAGTWDHLTVNTEISGGKAVFLSLTFNGTTYPINKSFYPTSKPNSESFGVHFQMDGDQSGKAYYAYVDEFTFKAW
ncbi:MAG: hypothetical protein JO249_06685 [Acidobacteria bacterium]|nr:hypothetical protein [Acidobacteriota bacterium]